MAAKSVDSAPGASHIAQQKLRHGRSADDLRTEGVLCPAHGINNSADLLHVSIFADGGIHVPGLIELVHRNSGDAGNHFRCVAREMFLHQLEDAARMLKREIVSRVRRQRWWSSSSSGLGTRRAARCVSL